MDKIVSICQQAVTSSLTVLFYLAGILLLIAASRLIFIFIRTNLLKKSLLSESLSVKLKELVSKYDLEGKLVLVSSSKPFAFCLGIIKSKIYISTRLLSLMEVNELEAILLHEKYHLDKKNNLLNLVLVFFQTLFLFMPFVSDIVRAVLIKNELGADHLATSTLKNRKDILLALKKLIQSNSYQPAYVSSFSHADALEKRIQKLNGNKISVSYISFKGMILSLVGLMLVSNLVFFLGKVQASDKIICNSKNQCQKNCHSEEIFEPKLSSQNRTHSSRGN